MPDMAAIAGRLQVLRHTYRSREQALEDSQHTTQKQPATLSPLFPNWRFFYDVLPFVYRFGAAHLITSHVVDVKVARKFHKSEGTVRHSAPPPEGTSILALFTRPAEEAHVELVEVAHEEVLRLVDVDESIGPVLADEPARGGIGRRGRARGVRSRGAVAGWACERGHGALARLVT